MISANRNLDRYAGFGHAVVTDAKSEFAGPLAGLLAAFSQARFELVCTAPCDSPFVPTDLVERLRAALLANDAEVAVARTADRIQPVFALYRSELRGDLNDYLATGESGVQAWQACQRRVEVRFDDTPEAFRNINTLEELAKLRSTP
jgi:molybdenum cofactor guanylyltransferase